jgi:hypothetical protein
VGHAEHEAVDAPPVHLVALELDGVDAQGKLTPITLTPAAPATDDAGPKVISTTTLRLRFDRFLLPGEATRQAFCLQSNAKAVPNAQSCTESVFVEPSYDPVWQRVTLKLRDGKLQAGVKYWLTLLVPSAKSPFGILAFDGAPLAAPVTLEFSVAAQDPPGSGPAPTPSGEELFCTASACVTACDAPEACATACPTGDAKCVSDCAKLCKSKCPVANSIPNSCGGCHGLAPDGTWGAAAGVDLSSAAMIASTAIGHAAHQTQTGEHASDPDEKPRRFGRAMPLLDPNNPGNSYLLYKMLISPQYAAMPAAPSQAEIDRLRASVVVGLPMPPSASYAVPLLGLENISAWITQGAPTPSTCP